MKKVLNGRDLVSGEFSFTITEVDENGTAVENGYTSQKSNGADGTVTFDQISYSEAGTHYYKVTEDAGTLGGVTYSSQSYTIKVDVVDNGDGSLSATADKQLTDLVFTNTYAAAASTNITATKVLSGREFKKGDTWTFTVTADSENASMPEHTTLTTSATSGNKEVLDFGNINYTLADAGKTYVYTITESGSVGGVINDAVTTRTVSVTVQDNGDGTLAITKVFKKGDNIVDSVEFTNKITSIKISKVDVTDQKELEGAHIQVLDKDGNVVDEWDSTKEAHEVTGLKTGEQYTLRETVAPDGYTVTSDTTFSLKADGTVDKDNTTTTVSDNGTLLVEDSRTSIKISKVDVTDQKELEGAHIQVLDKDGNVVDEWDSTKEAHEVTGLKTGEQYTLRETVAPDGYTVTSDTTFSLKADGTVDKDNTTTTVSDNGTLLVEDSRTSIKISKVDVADGKELEGAHIQLLDEDENIIEQWDSTKEAHVVEGLKTGKKYTLRETVAPTGYELTTDTTFVLKEDGTVDTENTTTVSKDGVLLVQDKLATGQSIAVTKKLTTATGDLKAMDQTFYVALYSDEACTQRVSDVKAIEFKNASSSTVVFDENIEVNKDYYIAECTQDGTAQSIGALADGTMYEAKFNDGNKAVVKEANGTTTVYFDNVFTSLPDGFYKQGKLTITKKLLGADGKAKKSDSVFYAGIFDDEAHTQLSTQVSQNIVKLDLAGGSEVSQVIKIGLDENKAVTLYVTETDSNGKPVEGNSGFAYTVSVDGSTVTIDEANENASVTITNTENPTTATITPAESEKGSSSSASSHSMSSSTKAPKTGDNTPIAMYVIILIAAAALIVFGFGKRRKKNK